MLTENVFSHQVRTSAIFSLSFTLVSSYAVFYGRYELIPIAVLALLLISYPVLGLMIAVLCEAWFSYAKIFGYPPRNYIALGLALILILSVLRSRKLLLGAETRKIYMVFIIFVILSFFVNFFNKSSIDNVLPYMLSKQAMPFLISLFIVTWFKNKLDVKLFIYFLTIVLSISAFVGIMQFFGIDFFWNVRLFISEPDLTSPISYQLLLRTRIPGLAYFAVPLSYQLGALVPLLASLLMHNKTTLKERFLLYIALPLLFMALLMTLVRSAIVGAIFGALYVFYFGKGNKVRKSFLIMVVLIIMMSGFVGARFKDLDTSYFARLPMALVGLKMALSNPIGSGVGSYAIKSEDYVYDVSNLPGSELVGGIGSHNQFVNVLVSYGFLGLILLIIFYGQMISVLAKNRSKVKDSFLGAVNLGLSGAFISYTINSFFHNAGLFYGDVFIWYFIGLLLAITNMAKINQGREYAKN